MKTIRAGAPELGLASSLRGPQGATMKGHRSVLAVASACLALGACGGVDEELSPVLRPQEGAFEALTYNVAGLPQGISGSDPVVNIPQMSPLLNCYDLVLVQEDFVYHDELALEAEHPYQSTPKEPYDKLVHDGLNRFSQFPWTRFTRVEWVACYGSATTGAGDCIAEKGFSLARTDLGEGVLVDIYNHHAEAGGGAEDIEARVAGFAQLIEYIRVHSEGRAVILGGDTNLHGDDPDDAPLLEQLMAETGLHDVCTSLGCGEDHIDRFFFRSNEVVAIEPVAWAVAEEFVDTEGEDLSDHPAIRVRFSWATQ